MSLFARNVQTGDADLYTGEEAGWAELAGATYEESRAVSQFNSDKIAGNAVVEDLFEAIQEDTGQAPDAFGLRNPYELNAWELFGESVLKGGNAVTARQSAIRELETRLWSLGRDEADRGFSPELRQRFYNFDLTRLRNDYRAEKIAHVQEVTERASGLTRMTAPLAGGVAGSFTDPTQVTLGLATGGTSSTVLGAAVREAAVNTALEGILQPVIAQNYQEAGALYGAGDVALSLASAALFGGLLGGGGKAAEIGLVGSPAYREARRAIEALPEDDPLRLAASPRRKDIIAAARKLEDRLPAEAREALALEEADVRYRDQTPAGSDPEEHARTLDEAGEAAIAPSAVPPPEPLPPRRRAEGPSLAWPENAFASGRRFEVDGKPVYQRSGSAMDLETDAGLMQYKGGGDAEGVTERLRGVARWNPVLAEEFLVWERQDGRRIVADGHQRSGLARRLIRSGAEEHIEVNQNVFREADGWTAEAVRAQAAKKNIAQRSGDVLDTAQVFRDSPDIIDDSLPVTDDQIRQARALATLSPDAWGMVRNGLIKPGHAAVIARYSGRPETHAAIVEAMRDANPANETEARILVGQTLEAGFRTERQQTLFGLEQKELSNLKPKMQLVTAVVKTLRDDKRVFSLLAREAERIEAAGNSLARGENEGRARTAASAEEILIRLATRRGPVSSRLNAAADRVANGEVTRKAAAGEIVGDGVRGLIVAPDPAGRPERTPVYDRSGARVFEDPEAAAEALEAEIDDQTGDLFGDGAAPETMDELFADPALRDAEAAVIARPETVPAGATFEALEAAGRRYDVDGQAVGPEAAREHLLARARSYAGGEPAREFQATIVLGLPGAGKSTVAEGLARARRAAIADPDDAKAIIPEFEGGIGSNAVHRESSLLADDVRGELELNGENLILPKVGKSAKSIDKLVSNLKSLGYSVTLLRAHVDTDEAARRMISRYNQTGRLILPDYFRLAASSSDEAWNAISKEGVNHGEIDITGPRGTYEPVGQLPGDIEASLGEAGLRPGGDRGRGGRGARRAGPGETPGAAGEGGLEGSLFGTVPNAEGGAARNWKQGEERIGRMVERFEGCVTR